MFLLVEFAKKAEGVGIPAEPLECVYVCVRACLFCYGVCYRAGVFARAQGLNYLAEESSIMKGPPEGCVSPPAVPVLRPPAKEG